MRGQRKFLSHIMGILKVSRLKMRVIRKMTMYGISYTVASFFEGQCKMYYQLQPMFSEMAHSIPEILIGSDSQRVLTCSRPSL